MLLRFKRVFRKSHGVDGIPVDSRNLRHSPTLAEVRGQEEPTNPTGDSKRPTAAKSSAEDNILLPGVKIRTPIGSTS